MKTMRYFVSVLCIVFSAVNVSAEDEYTYMKLFESGKSWDVIEEYYHIATDQITIVNKLVCVDGEIMDGDHLVNKIVSTNIQTYTSYSYNFLEENRTIYNRDSETYRTIIDFNLRKGDPVPIEDGSDGLNGMVVGYDYIVNDEIIEIKGIKRRIVSIGSQKDGEPFTYWIEGIGSIHDWIMLIYPQPISSDYLKSRRISACYQDGKCIFSHEDLENYIRQCRVKKIDNVSEVNGYFSYGRDALEVNGFSGNVRVEIYSMDGTLCISETVRNGQTVSTSALTNGCFIARANSNNGASATLKFIK